MKTVEPDAKQPEPETCRNWAEIIKTFDSFRPPRLSFDWEGDLDRDTWIFRGLKSADYGLAPSIEWTIKQPEQWAAFEPLLGGAISTR